MSSPDWNELPPELLFKVAMVGVPFEMRTVCKAWKAALECAAMKAYIRGSDLPLNLGSRYLALASLDLTQCASVTVEALRSLYGMPRLANLSLRLSDADFTTEFLDAIRGLSLASLDLGSPYHINGPQLKMLRGLPLVRVNLSAAMGVKEDDFLENLRGMPLTQLHLGERNNFTNAGLEVLKEMPLTDLDLGWEHRFSDAEALRGLPLKFLKLGGGSNGFSDPALLVLRDVHSLVSLDLGGSYRITDEGLVTLRGIPLTAFDFGGCVYVECPFTDAALEGLVGMPLTSLSLFWGVTDAALGLLQGMPLTNLRLPSEKITDASLRLLQGFPLMSLDLTSTSITDAGRALLQGIPLKRLVLDFTAIRGHGLRSLSGMLLNVLSVINCQQLDPWAMARFWEARFREEARLRSLGM